uniref:Uncharacterized protein n=1 Tax=Aureoumbra lagunensis TaxID=44058 RepID=A0A7S3K194_9STRA|mmetsp:Transcript_4414/g.6267  ORF Transcript_4414/g.6267 Transcript_4414/m.6267 type:complete len:347 (-) Transcript_4414:56-1096(-)
METFYGWARGIFLSEEDELVREYLASLEGDDVVEAESSWWLQEESEEPWWSRISCMMPEAPDPQIEAEEHVRSYWGDAVHDEALDNEEYRRPVRRELIERKEKISTETTSATLFATEELNETELAELGRMLAKSGGSVEERARLTQEYIAQRRDLQTDERSPKPGTSAWRDRLDIMRGELFKDKKQLSSRHAKRAQFLDQANKSEAKFASAKMRARFSRHRLLDLRSRRANSTNNCEQESHVNPDDDNFSLSRGSGRRKLSWSGIGREDRGDSSSTTNPSRFLFTGRRRSSTHRSPTPPDSPTVALRRSYTSSSNTLNTTPASEDEETMEYRAAVDLFWKGRDDAI